MIAGLNPAAQATTRCDRTPVWAQLQAHFESGAQPARAFDLRQAFAADPTRFEAFSQQAPHVFVDLSKNLIDAPTEALLQTLARQCGVTALRDAMFAGLPINNTEQRPVMHFLLRQPARAPGEAAQPCDAELTQVHATLDAMLAYAEQVRADAGITDVVNIGIGGSDLGPQMAVQALAEFAMPGKRLHFVSNVDGHELAGLLARLHADKTLFLVASKTFTTTETMTNALSARHWFEAQLGAAAPALIARHFAALTTNVAAAREFGISTTFGFWDWIGGRCRWPSALALPVSGRCWQARTPWISIFATRPPSAICPCAWACWTSGTATFMASAAATSRRTTAPCGAGRLTCSSWRWRATASAWTAKVKRCPLARRPCSGASPAPTASTLTSRCCTREPTWCPWNSLP
jgi:hypothetical protein